jgi:hypothetical protein
MPVMAPAAVASVATVKAGQSAFVLTNLGQALKRLQMFAPKASTVEGAMRGAAQPILSGGQ